MDQLINSRLQIISYNVFSIKRKFEIVKVILLNYEILLCQEIILHEKDCYLLSHSSKDFCVKYISSKQSQTPMGDGRPVGDLAIFLRKKN